MATFAGITFTIIGYSQQRRGSSQVSVRPIPGGTIAYLDRAGPTPIIAGYTVQTANYAIWAQLEAKRGESGSLIDFDGTFTATMLSCDRTERYMDGECRGSAEFVIEA